jgi:hypothetical protein
LAEKGYASEPFLCWGYHRMRLLGRKSNKLRSLGRRLHQSMWNAVATKGMKSKPSRLNDATEGNQIAADEAEGNEIVVDEAEPDEVKAAKHSKVSAAQRH